MPNKNNILYLMDSGIYRYLRTEKYESSLITRGWKNLLTKSWYPGIPVRLRRSILLISILFSYFWTGFFFLLWRSNHREVPPAVWVFRPNSSAILCHSWPSSLCRPGPAGCRHVQLLLQRRRLRSLLCNSEYAALRKKQTCFRGNARSCGGSLGGGCASQLICFAVVSLHGLYDLPPSRQFPPGFLFFHSSVCAALRGPGRLPQKVSHCAGERFADHPGTARYTHTHTQVVPGILLL